MSSNELQSLPSELCSLPSLRDLNVRRNQLSTLPDGEENEGVRVCVCVSTLEELQTRNLQGKAMP